MNSVGFMISKEEDSALGPGTRLDHSRAFVWQSLKYKKGTEKLLTQTSEGRQRVPPTSISLSRGATYLFQTQSHNIHLKLTRLELTIEISYQTHSHSINLKITRLVRRFLLRKTRPGARYTLIFLH